jgi:hypothetical protein
MVRGYMRVRGQVRGQVEGVKGSRGHLLRVQGRFRSNGNPKSSEKKIGSETPKFSASLTILTV